MGSTDVGFDLLRQVARNDLVHLLQMVAETKDLVIEKQLMRALDTVASMQLLRQNGVAKIYQLDASGGHIPWSDTATHRMYLLRPTMANAKHVADHWMAEKNTNNNADGAVARRRFTCVFVPRKLFVCEHLLEQYGVHGEIELQEFNATFLALEHDLLSLELPEFFASVFLHRTNTWQYTAARALHHLQTLYGPIAKRFVVGETARQVSDLLDVLCHELGEPRMVVGNEHPMTQLFMFDRSLDYVTPLLTCFTYESLLHETFGIDCASADLSMTSAAAKQAGRVQLNNQDEVFASVRNSHISAVFPFLSAKAKTLQHVFQKSKEYDVTDLKQFVKSELRTVKQQHRSLEMHIGASEVVSTRWQGIQRRMQAEHDLVQNENHRDTMNYIEECLAQQNPEHQNLALICLASVTQNGLPTSVYQSLRRQFVHAHGFQHISTFYALKQLGVVTEQISSRSAGTDLVASGGGSSGRLVSKASTLKDVAIGSLSASGALPAGHFQQVTRRLALLPKADVANKLDVRDPNDMSYVFNGSFTPLLCQLVARTLQSGFEKDEWGRLLQCPIGTFEEPLAGRTHAHTHQTILVYILGGVTYAEIAAFRLLARMRGCRIVIATTNIIGQRDFAQLVTCSS